MHARRGIDRGEEIRPQAHRAQNLWHNAGYTPRLARRVKLGQRALSLRLFDHLDACHRPGNASVAAAVTPPRWLPVLSLHWEVARSPRGAEGYPRRPSPDHPGTGRYTP